MSTTVHTFCRICEALCGLEATIEHGKVTDLRPDHHHVATQGFACPKGLKQHRIYDSPDRVLAPLRRVHEGEHETTSWSQALDDIGARVRSLVEKHGPDAVAMYVGTAAGFSVLHPVFAQGFMTGLGSKSMYSSSTQDCANKFAVSRLLYGHPFTLPFPDLEHTKCLVIVGANPVVSKWSFLQVPNPAKTLKNLVSRGGKLFVVDPRKTETAHAAGTHLFLRPNTDPWFFASFLHELLRQGGVDRERLRRFSKGFAAIETLVEPWSPERTERVTRIPAAELRSLVTSFREASPRAAIYCSTGVNMGSNGSLAFWLAECINMASGALDHEGGTLVGRGLIDFPAFGKRTGTLLRNDRSRIGNFPSVNDGFPGGLLADEILTPGPKQVRALFVTGGNPLLTMPNAARLREAFRSLELLVTIDIFRNETGSIAHYVLPATTPLERPDLPFIFPLMLGLQRKPYVQATEALLTPPGDVRDEATIYLDLCRAAGAPLFASRIAQRVLELATTLHSRKRSDRRRAVPQEALLDLLLRITGQIPFSSLLQAPHGLLRATHRPHDFLGKRVLTEDQLVDLAPAVLLDQANARLEVDFAREEREARTLKLITKRAVTTHNSWTHNLPDFVQGERGTNYLYMHPDDALERGLHEDSIAEVQSDTATVRLPVRFLSELMPGVVALPHGWGHQHAAGLSTAKQTRGVNANLLAADGPDRLERVSGMAHLTGFAVQVRVATEPQNPHSWSGV